ncbi:VOC family protein [Maribius pontilimi]|uniref:VOC family protein n=1 Tax=Palleronia pontilimi TaxID=1964209 RepID=A0A934IHP6_9RHOB|nr:VOC family protein [Palleronia pontilimi]MBJ3763123.1 VOC family protein [Palleronia pontilimi]
MLDQIKGLHHITSLASDARTNNAFFTDALGLRRVKKTVNFDAPDVYHLYYGDATGAPGSVMTYFPFPHAAPGRPGAGEVGTTAFAIPAGSADWWGERLALLGARATAEDDPFGARRLAFAGPDGDAFALVEDAHDTRAPWSTDAVPEAHAIRGFHSASLRVRDPGATRELLGFMGYEPAETRDGTMRMVRPGGTANVIDIDVQPGAPDPRPGAGSVHHIAFAVDNRARQLEVREALMDTGYQVTPVIDRDYFWAIYFRTPDGILFEIATNEPGFDRDEDPAHLGEALKLPAQHEHLRAKLQSHLQPIE